MELQTERLLLREYTVDDLAAVHAFAAYVRIAKYVDWGQKDPVQLAAITNT